MKNEREGNRNYYKTTKRMNSRFFQKVDKQFRINQKLLKKYNKIGKANLCIEKCVGSLKK